MFRYITCFGLACMVILILGLAISVQPAYACSPVPTPDGPTPIPMTLESRVQNIPVIFEGTVTAMTEDRALTTVQVSRYFKGEGPGSVTITGFGWGTDCLPEAYVGEHAIFYTFGDPTKELSIPSGGNVEAVDDAKVEAIIKAVGHDPVLVPDQSVQTAVALIGLGMMIVVIVMIVWLKRKPKES